MLLGEAVLVVVYIVFWSIAFHCVYVKPDKAMFYLKMATAAIILTVLSDFSVFVYIAKILSIKII